VFKESEYIKNKHLHFRNVCSTSNNLMIVKQPSAKAAFINMI